MGTLNVAVIGAGYLGKFHAEKYASHDHCKLIGVADIDANAAQSVADSFENASAYTSHEPLLDLADAVSIVTYTPAHFVIARDFLSKGKHVLLEKPMTSTEQEAQTLIDLAETNRTVLQVGHIERFNPAVLALDEHLNDLKFIESHRLSPFRSRGTDVNVVLDLMIHDIDIILSIVKADIRSIESSGMQVLSDDIDIANARITFANNCVANVTASRVSDRSERKMRLFQTNAYFSCDLANHAMKMYTRNDTKIDAQSFEFAKPDALLSEINHFIDCIQSNKTPLVTGTDGLRALKTAKGITDTMQVHHT